MLVNPRDYSSVVRSVQQALHESYSFEFWEDGNYRRYSAVHNVGFDPNRGTTPIDDAEFYEFEQSLLELLELGQGSISKAQAYLDYRSFHLVSFYADKKREEVILEQVASIVLRHSWYNFTVAVADNTNSCVCVLHHNRSISAR